MTGLLLWVKKYPRRRHRAPARSSAAKVSESALGRGHGVGFSRIPFDGKSKGAGNRFKGCFGNMVAVETLNSVNMQCYAAIPRKSLKELPDKLRVESTDFSFLFSC